MGTAWSWAKGKTHSHPFDAVINPSDYFINLYPCFKELFIYDDQKQSRIEYVKRSVSIKIDKGVDILRHQFGRWLGFLGSGLAMMKRVWGTRLTFSVPKRFELTKQDWARISPA